MVVALAREHGLPSPAEVEDQAAVLLSAFAIEWPDHPVARYFDLADDAQIEEFFVAVARQARAAWRDAAAVTIELYLN